MLGRIEVSEVLSGKCVHHSAFAASLALTRRSNECVHFRNWALFGSHVMSALGPEYAPNRTYAHYSEFLVHALALSVS